MVPNEERTNCPEKSKFYGTFVKNKLSKYPELRERTNQYLREARKQQKELKARNANCEEIGGSSQTSKIGAVSISFEEYKKWKKYLMSQHLEGNTWHLVFPSREN